MGGEAAVKPYYAVPSYPGRAQESGEQELTRALHIVAEYAGVSLIEAFDLPVDLYLICLKNGTIERLQRTEEGRKYLDDCERYSKTKMDKSGLRTLMAQMNGQAR